MAATILYLLCALAVTTTIALWPANPDRPMRQIQEQLVLGKPVTLVGPTGRPVWSRWQAGEANSRITEDQILTIVSPSMALLELLPDMPIDAYRFSAEIRQWGHVQGPAGLFIGHCKIDTGKAVLHGLCSWDSPDLDKEDGQAFMSLNLRCREPIPLLAERRFYQNSTYVALRENAPPLAVWPRLTLEVTPRVIRVFWQGRLMAEKSRIDLQKAIQDQRELRSAQYQEIGFSPGDPGPKFNARGGLGLLIDECTASFRNVTIEPLSGEN